MKFDTWIAYRAGAMTYRDSANQWILTTGLPLESVVLVRDHVGNCFDVTTMSTLVWDFIVVTAEEPRDPITELVKNRMCDAVKCAMALYLDNKKTRREIRTCTSLMKSLISQYGEMNRLP